MSEYEEKRGKSVLCKAYCEIDRNVEMTLMMLTDGAMKPVAIFSSILAVLETALKLWLSQCIEEHPCHPCTSSSSMLASIS